MEYGIPQDDVLNYCSDIQFCKLVAAYATVLMKKGAVIPQILTTYAKRTEANAKNQNAKNQNADQNVKSTRVIKRTFIRWIPAVSCHSSLGFLQKQLIAKCPLNIVRMFGKKRQKETGSGKGSGNTFGNGNKNDHDQSHLDDDIHDINDINDINDIDYSPISQSEQVTILISLMIKYNYFLNPTFSKPMFSALRPPCLRLKNLDRRDLEILNMFFYIKQSRDERMRTEWVYQFGYGDNDHGYGYRRHSGNSQANSQSNSRANSSQGIILIALFDSITH